ncbi:RING finger protein 148-like [Notechis scutatus]|uniref:RING finger protein 148-like n=1 Tax=Notechis scutatus TaxID=8663 RepID=A0A6J1US60_9SAUR|nr:RING finger protein 148-like [Notechis scutatus]
MKGGRKPSPARFLILASLFSAVQALPNKANVTLVYFNTLNQSSTNHRCECGMFGVHSPVAEARGLVVLSNSSELQACMWDTHFAPAVSPWIALIARGNCTFTEKIKRAAKLGASAVVIYNYAKYGNNSIHMAHPGEVWVPTSYNMEKPQISNLV